MRLLPRPRQRLFIGALLVLSLIVGGCAGATTPAPTEAPPPTAAPATPAPTEAPPPTAAPATPAPTEALPSPGPETCRDAGPGPLITESSGSLVAQAEQVAYKNPFATDCGVEVQTVDGVSDVGAQIAAMFEANNITWDVISGRGEPDLLQLVEKGYIAPIDKSLIQVDPSRLVSNTVLDYGIGGEIDALGLAYKTELFKDNPPSSWADFFDTEKYPGPRMMSNWGGPDQNIAHALLGAGVKTADLTPFDYDLAFQQLDKVKKDLILYESGASMVQHMLNNEAVMCQCTDGRVQQMNRAGGGMTYNYEGAYLAIQYWAILKGAPHERLAQHFLASTLDPQRAAVFTTVTGYPTTVLDSVNYLSPAFAATLSISPENLPKTFSYTREQTEWVASHWDEITKKWNDWLQMP